MFDLLFLILAAIVFAVLFGGFRVITDAIPAIDTSFLTMGLTDATDPRTAANNRAYAELIRSGVLDVNPGKINEGLGKGGDFINIPSLFDPADVDRNDLSTTPLTASAPDAIKDVSVISHAVKLYAWERQHEIRTGHMSIDQEFSLKLGGKVAKRAFERLMSTSIGAIQAIDIPAADAHYTDDSGGTNLLTVERLRALKALMGDRASDLTTVVMHSTPAANLLKDLIDTYKVTNIGFEALRGAFQNILGITNFIITDLVPTVAGPDYYTLLFGAGALVHAFQQSPEINRDLDLANPSTLKRLKIEYAEITHLRLVKWNVATINPTDANLTTVSNWDEAVEVAVTDNHKRIPAVLLRTDG